MVERLLYALLFFTGWISGGGGLAIAAMFLLEWLGATPTNDWFVAGCLWGPFGSFAGNFMVRHFKEQEARNVR